MDVKSYCDSVGAELTGWKAKLYDVIRKADSMSGEDKSKVDPLVQQLNSIVDDLDERLELLARECPTEWASDQDEIEGKITQMRGKWKDVWGVMGETEYGVGGA